MNGGPERPRGWTDERVEQFLGNLLRAGVLLAAAVVLVGGVLYLAHDAREVRHYARRDFEDPARRLIYARGPAEFVRDALTGDSRGIIQLGILLLIATPVARVVFSVAAFALERDGTYVVVTLVVLAVLLYSLLAGGQ